MPPPQPKSDLFVKSDFMLISETALLRCSRVDCFVHQLAACCHTVAIQCTLFDSAVVWCRVIISGFPFVEHCDGILFQALTVINASN